MPSCPVSPSMEIRALRRIGSMSSSAKCCQRLSQVPGEQHHITMNLMLPVVVRSTEKEKLQVMYQYPSTGQLGYDPTAQFEKGEGAAGLAWRDGLIVYVPAIRYLHAVTIQLPTEGHPAARDVKPNVYKRVRLEPYASILCVPVQTATDIAGIVNVDCPTQNRFDEDAMEFASVAASLIAMAIDKFRVERDK